MQLIGAAFGDNVHDRAGIASILRLKVGNHTNFGDRINWQNRRRRAEHSRLIDGRVVTIAVIHVGSVE